MSVIQSEGALATVQSQWSMSTRSYGSLSLYGAYNEDYASIYRTQPNVRTVVSFLARNIASLGLKVYERVSDDERNQLSDHPMAKTIRRPTPWTTRYAFLESMVSDLGTYDVYCAVKVRGEQGQVRLLRVPPQYVEPQGKTWFRAESYRLFGSDALVFKAEDVVFIHGHNPDDPKTGLSPLESIRRILAEDAASGEYREWMWRNKARIEGVLQTDKAMSDAAQERLRAQWKQLYAGAKGSGETAILEEGLKFQEITMTSRDAQYMEARKLSREEVAAAYHVQPAMVGILEHANFANISEQHKMLYQDSLGPWLVRIEEELELQLLPEFSGTDNVYLEFNIAEKLKGSFEDQVKAGQASVGAPWVTRNEMRARMNLPPVDGGDDLVTPLNVLTGGQASPLDADPTKPNNGTPALPEGPGMPADDVSKLVAAATALVRAGFDPGESLEAVGLDPVRHLGLLPITLQNEEEAPAPKSKARPESIRRRRQQHAAKHEEVLKAFFGKQRDVVLSRLGAKAKATADDAFDSQRWNKDLHAKLLGLGEQTAKDFAQEIADEYGVEVDASLMGEYLEKSASIASENINKTTRDAIAAALKNERDVKEIFEILVTTRAGQIALSRASNMANFGQQEGAKQSGVTEKVWVVVSPKSRHPEMNGESVPINGVFSNGMRWPGDAAGGVDEAAHCQCLLAFA